jgi:hypothetical protein
MARMPKQLLRLGILAVSRKPVSRWGTRGFVPSQVLPEVPATPPRTRLGPEGDVETWYAGPADLVLHSGETGHYRDNLRMARPSVWVALRQGTALEIAGATVDPYEGEGLAGDPGLVVEALPMPAAVAEAMAAFFAAHHVEQVFEKRKRKRADPEALARGAPRVMGPGRDRT